MNPLQFCTTSRRALCFAAAVLVLAAACSNPNSPTPPPPPPPPPPPVANPPSLSCGSPISANTTVAAGTAVTFTTPSASDGQAPVTVACSPASGTTFPIGVTTVQCTATDALNRSASCSFPVTVSRTPELTLTKFLAFGDSITEGEVTVPVTGITPLGGSFRLRIVPSASYPAVLRNLLAARYTAQANSIIVINDGKAGEKARDSATLTRFAQSVATHRPEVVLLMHGYNDIENSSVITDTVNAVDAMAAEARNRRVGRVFMLNLAPPRPGGSNARPTSSILAFNERLERAARGEGAVLVDVYSALLPAVSANIGVDGLHPTEIGYRKIAETVLEAIRANLERR